MSKDPREINLASVTENGDLTAEARDRLTKRLQQDRGPSAAAQSFSWVDWGAEQDWLGQPWDATRIPLNKLDQMRRDPILAFALMFVKVPLIRAPWYIKCSDPKIAAAVDSSLRKIYGRFILAYCNSLDYGFSPMVKRFEYLENPDWTYVPGDDPRAVEQPVWTNKTVKPLVWKPFTALNPRQCRPHWSVTGKFNGIDFANKGSMGADGMTGWPASKGAMGYQASTQRADVPIDWALWATNEKDSVFGSYWGYPRIGYAYRFWWSYWYRFGIADRAFERWGDPPLVGYFPDDPLAVDDEGNRIDYLNTALGILERARSGANIAFPSTVVTSIDEKPSSIREWSAEQMKTNIEFSAIGDVFRYLDVQKIRSVMVPEQALIEGEGGTSSRNVASTFGDLFEEAQMVIKEEIDDHLNRWVIPQFVALNFGPDAPRAEIVTTGFDKMDLDAMKTVFQLLGQNEPNSMSVVDVRALAEQMGIPTISRAEMNKKLEDAAAEAEKQAALQIKAQQGANESAGVSKTGLYYPARELIIVPEKKSDENEQLRFAEVLNEVKGIADRVRDDSLRKTEVHLELPKSEDEGEFQTIKEFERDDEGFVKNVKERRVRIEDSEES